MKFIKKIGLGIWVVFIFVVIVFFLIMFVYTTYEEIVNPRPAHPCAVYEEDFGRQVPDGFSSWQERCLEIHEGY